jgi:hypothetical protein
MIRSPFIMLLTSLPWPRSGFSGAIRRGELLGAGLDPEQTLAHHQDKAHQDNNSEKEPYFTDGASGFSKVNCRILTSQCRHIKSLDDYRTITFEE